MDYNHIFISISADYVTNEYSILQQYFSTARDKLRSPVYPAVEETKDYWNTEAQQRLLREVNHVDTDKQAKNVIIFLGDGMGVSTLTAARIAKGQQAGLEGGEQAVLSFEEFPHLALSRTYCVDSTGNIHRDLYLLLEGIDIKGISVVYLATFSALTVVKI